MNNVYQKCFLYTKCFVILFYNFETLNNLWNNFYLKTLSIAWIVFLITKLFVIHPVYILCKSSRLYLK